MNIHRGGPSVSRRSLLLASLASLLVGCGRGDETSTTSGAEISAVRDRHVVVVGAGIAGLAATLELLKRGARVTLVESEPEVGGRVKSIPIPGTADLRL